MTLATLRRMEWAGAPITGLDNIPIRTCPDCCVSERRGHAPDCALDAAIREAEQAEKGTAAPKVGDVVWLHGFGFREVAFPDEARVLTGNDGVAAIYRQVWRQEPPTHD